MPRLIAVRVLVVDDDEAVCRRLATWLADAAYDVATFTDPQAALEYARKVESRLGLVDLRLPTMEGAELIRELRQISPALRIIALAAFPEVREVIAAVRAGARDVLEKPLQPAAVLEALERQLAEIGVSVRTEEDYNRRLGARLRAARAGAGLTLQSVARECGLSEAQLSAIELGRTATSTWTLARICAALRIPPATLLNGL